MPVPILRWTVGDLRITRVLEVEVSGLSFLIPDAVPGNLRSISWVRPGLVTPAGEAVACIQSFLVESAGRKLLIDTCVGEERQAGIPTRIERSARFLEELARAGAVPGEIDTVVFTHLHFDHVGWASRPERQRRIPTFARARYVIARPEWEHWSSRRDPETRALLADSFAALVDSKQLDFVAPDEEVAPGIHLEPTPGHTPGHVCVHLASHGAEAIVTGDLMHHPAQMAHPSWWSTFDTDRDQARETRLRFLERNAGSDALIIGTHFAEPTAGHIARDGAVFRFAM